MSDQMRSESSRNHEEHSAVYVDDWETLCLLGEVPQTFEGLQGSHLEIEVGYWLSIQAVKSVLTNDRRKLRSHMESNRSCKHTCPVRPGRLHDVELAQILGYLAEVEVRDQRMSRVWEGAKHHHYQRQMQAQKRLQRYYRSLACVAALTWSGSSLIPAGSTCHPGGLRVKHVLRNFLSMAAIYEQSGANGLSGAKVMNGYDAMKGALGLSHLKPQLQPTRVCHSPVTDLRYWVHRKIRLRLQEPN